MPGRQEFRSWLLISIYFRWSYISFTILVDHLDDYNYFEYYHGVVPSGSGSALPNARLMHVRVCTKKPLGDIRGI